MSLGNEHWQQMRNQILILGSEGLKQDFLIKALHLSSSGFLELEIGYYNVHPAWIVGSLRYSRTPLFRSLKENGKKFEIAGF